jgi:hypothetical protein
MRDAHVLGPEWDDPIPSHPSNLSDSPLAREDPVDSSVPHLTSILPSSEGDTAIILTSEGVANDESSSAITNPDAHPLPRSGWNNEHRYHTRFRKHVMASTTLPDYLEFNFTPAHQAMAFVAEQVAINSDNLGSPTEVNPYSFLAADSSDVLHWGQMTRDPDRSKFQAAMQEEIDGLFRHDTLYVVPSSTMPPGTKPLSAIWSFRKKRLPCWTIVKWKSRLCPHGGQQVFGVNFWHTYAPVVK